MASRGLDQASSDDIRRTLERAIASQQRRRSLFVAPGIVEGVATAGRVRIIFETAPGPTQTATAALLAGGGTESGFEALRVFPLLNRGAASVGPEALLHLIEHAGTGSIELDSIHRTSLDSTIPVIRADIAHQRNYDGDGFAVAVLDTGVDSTHPMLVDRIVEEACFSAGEDCPNGLSEMFGPGAGVPCAINGCGHGTRVAGVVAGDQPGGTLIGVAPHASLIVIQIFSDIAGEPGAYSSDILAGLQHVLGLAAFHRIAAVNLSLGGSLFTSEASCDQSGSSQFSAVALLRNAGILTVSASGNDHLTNAITTPACLSNVIGVGATSDDDVVSAFSNSSEFLELLAPGVSVTSSSVGGGTATTSGTSIATPHVAGAIAAIREAFPNASATEVENALILSGLPVEDSRNGITKTRIRVVDAIDLIATLTAPAGDPADPADPVTNGGGTGTPSSSGGGGCGLVGIEPLLVLGIARLGRRRRALRARTA